MTHAAHLRFVVALCISLVAGVTPAAAQSSLAAAVDARGSPGGSVVASLLAGARVARGPTAGATVLVTIDGWVDESRLGGKRDRFPATVSGTRALRLRATPSPQGAIVGELRPGAGVVTLGLKGPYMHVRRTAWIPASALGKNAAAAATAAALPLSRPESAQREQPTTSGPPGSLSATRASKILASPAGSVLGDVAPGTIVQPLARDREWVRVRVEGWVKERDFAPADSSFTAGLTAADLRADPQGTRGRIVRWEVQVLSLQVADPLRRDLGRDEPYLLAKGPGGENALLYLTIPPALLAEARTLAPLTMVVVTARVRTGRSEPVGTPILELRTISKR